MYLLPTSNYLLRNLSISHLSNTTNRKVEPMKHNKAMSGHQQRVLDDMKRLGATKLELFSSEANYLHKVIHHEEQIGGLSFGHHESGYCMLVATNRRVVFLDKKPFFANVDDITYDVVSGVSFGHAGFGSTLTLHTRIKDFKLMTMNDKSAKIFVDYVQLRCLEHEKNNGNSRQS
ncbi:MAG: bPH 3 protein [Patescibacteria group bacterium]|jgi:hypothetical protein|nr:bPH 3 protein [Patescibacteria group bacterium]